MKHIFGLMILVFISKTNFSQSTYTFYGNGNWTDPNNWIGNNIPPNPLNDGSTIYIAPNPGDTCKLNISQTISFGSKIFVTSGSNLIINGNLDITAILPTLTTNTVNNITYSSAKTGGSIASDGGSPILTKGVVWDISPSPTIGLSPNITSGSSLNNYTIQINNLLPAKTYYVRAYATNNVGTSYGNEFSFVTTDYPSVNICDSIWMQKNLDVVTYRNGDTIPEITNATQWASLTTGGWCYLNYNSNNGPTYGKLYNAYAVIDPRGLAPEGWHIPSEASWTSLANCLGGEVVAGGALKEIGTTHWLSPNAGATNISGFTALSQANCSTNGTFLNGGGTFGFWWSSLTQNNLQWSHTCYYNDAHLQTFGADMKNGYSVRCIKD